VLWHSGTPSAVPGLKALEEPARLLRLQLQLVGVRTAEELEGAFATMARDGAQAVLVLGTPFFITARQRLAELAIAHRLPTMFQGRPYVEAGGLMSYFPNHEDLWRHGAVYVDKILRGAKPADLPVEQVTKLERLINLKTAKALGLTIPQSVLLRADEAIQ
jgi:putative ABC transport system substrate-binding protein